MPKKCPRSSQALSSTMESPWRGPPFSPGAAPLPEEEELPFGFDGFAGFGAEEAAAAAGPFARELRVSSVESSCIGAPFSPGAAPLPEEEELPFGFDGFAG